MMPKKDDEEKKLNKIFSDDAKTPIEVEEED